MSAKKVRKDSVVYRRPWVHPYPIEAEVAVRQKGPDMTQKDGPISSLTDEMDFEAELRVRRERMSWSEWARKDLLRYWYWLVTLALVAFGLMQISWTYHVRDAAGVSALAILGFAQIVVIFYVYRFIWPEGAFTEGWPAAKRLRKGYRRLRLRLRWRL